MTRNETMRWYEKRNIKNLPWMFNNKLGNFFCRFFTLLLTILIHNKPIIIVVLNEANCVRISVVLLGLAFPDRPRTNVLIKCHKYLCTVSTSHINKYISRTSKWMIQMRQVKGDEYHIIISICHIQYIPNEDFFLWINININNNIIFRLLFE